VSNTTNRDPEWDWRYKAECRKHDPDLWNATPGEYESKRTKQAKFICRQRCTVMDECLKQALDTGETNTILGGMLPRERLTERGLRRSIGNIYGISEVNSS